MEAIFDKIFDVFCIEYMFIVIMASYFIIKIIDVLNGKRVVPTWAKRIVTSVVGIISFIIFKEYTEESIESLISSFFAALFVYDSAIKFLIKKLKVDYRK